MDTVAVRISFILMIRRTPRATLFPCTTLFRSKEIQIDGDSADRRGPLRMASQGGQSRCPRTIEHTPELQPPYHIVCRLLLDTTTSCRNRLGSFKLAHRPARQNRVRPHTLQICV